MGHGLSSLSKTVISSLETLSLSGASSVDGRPIEVRLELADGLPSVRGDAAEIRGVIASLVRNALDAMPDGGTLRLSTRSVDDAPGRDAPCATVLAVTDGGGGMAPEFRERMLFRPFVSTRPDGMGLGLFQSKRVVESYGGRLRALAGTGPGTTFELELPA